MQAAIINKPGNIELIETDFPDINDNEVLVKVKCVGLCGSDIGLYHGKYEGVHSYPIIFGHEWSGEIVEVGNYVIELKKNDRITGDCSLWCGDCSFCDEDKNLCRNIQKFGITKDGACREYFSINKKYIYKASENIPFEVIAFTEPFSVSFNALFKLENIGIKKALVIGTGAIGLSAVYLLKNYFNCVIVDAVDLMEYRLLNASRLGADNTAQEVQENDYDLIVIAAGSNAALNNSLKWARPGGTILCIGHMKNAPINSDLIVNKAIKIIGSIGGTGQFQKALEIFNDDYDTFKDIITHRFGLDSVNEAFQIDPEKEESLKIIINL